MKEFPQKLDVSNKNKFKLFNYNRVKAYLRRHLYEHILSNEEKDYFSIDNFWSQYNTPVEPDRMITEVRDELHRLGWKTEVSFGGTGLFIYSNEKPPNCFPDGF